MYKAHGGKGEYLLKLKWQCHETRLLLILIYVLNMSLFFDYFTLFRSRTFQSIMQAI